jgi:type VI protein secretion system component VasF
MASVSRSAVAQVGGGVSPQDPGVVRVRAYDLRSSAQEALFRVQMLTDDEALSEAAEAVLEDVTALRKTDSRTELDQRRVKTRDDISRLVRASKRHL